MDNKREFKGIWIFVEIWLFKDFILQEKVFLVEIDSFDNDEGCWVNNEYFVNFFGIFKVCVSKVINFLKEKGKIFCVIIEEKGNKRILIIF